VPEGAPRLRAAAPLLGLLVLLAFLFPRLVFTRDILFERDVHLMYFGVAQAFVESITEGGLPLWNPRLAFGEPLLAKPFYQAAYPPTWLNLVLLPHQYFKVFALAHCFFGGAGVLFLARRLGASRGAAFLGGATALCSGPFLSVLTTWHHFAGAAWTPWVLVGVDGVLERPGALRALALAAVVAGQILAGSGDMCLVTGFLAAAYLVFGGRRLSRGAFSWAGVGLLLALGVSSVQLLPSLALLRGSSRTATLPAANMYWSVHPASLLDLAVPRLVADFPMSQRVRHFVMESREPFLRSLYLGVSALVFVLACPGRRWLFPAFGGLFLLLASLGRFFPLFPLLLHLPLVRLMRFPVKLLVPSGVLLGLLVAQAWDAFLRPWGPRERSRGLAGALLAFSLTATLLVLAHVIPLRAGPWSVEADGEEASFAATQGRLVHAALASGAMGLLLLIRSLREVQGVLAPVASGVILLDLVVSGAGVNKTAPPELASRPALVKAMGAGARVYVQQADTAELNHQFVRGPAGWSRDAAWALGLDAMAVPPSASRWGVFGSYDGELTGLASPELETVGMALRKAWPGEGARRLLEVAAVQFVVALNGEVPPGLVKRAEEASVFRDPIQLFALETPLPRSYVAGGRRPVDPEAIAPALLDTGFDPRREVLLPPGTPGAAPPPDFVGDSRIVWRKPDALGLEARSSSAGYVVLNEAYERGWRAWLDGSPTALVQANGLFRAVAVPGGRHTVVMRYRPPSVFWGLFASLASIASGVALLVATRRGAQP
jgi:hypothetical protein